MRVLLANDASPHSHAAADYLLAISFRNPVDVDVVVDVVSVLTPPMMIDPGMGGMPIA